MKIAALFPGYGSQSVGMGKELYDESRIMQEHFELAAGCVDINFVKLCFASSDVELAKMAHAYMSLFLVSSSIYDLIQSEGVEVDVVAGYNIGQFAAMHAAGTLSLPDGLYFLNKFVPLYKELLKENKFMVVNVFGISSSQLEQLCEQVSTTQEYVSISVYTAETEHTISGNPLAVAKVSAMAVDLEGMVETIGPEVGLHSSSMLTIIETVSQYLEKIDFKDSTVPLLCNLDAHKIKIGREFISCVIGWIANPIRWSEVVDSLDKYDLLLEIGPGTKLRDRLKIRYPDKKIMSINVRADIERLKKMLNIGEIPQEK